MKRSKPYMQSETRSMDKLDAVAFCLKHGFSCNAEAVQMFDWQKDNPACEVMVFDLRRERADNAVCGVPHEAESRQHWETGHAYARWKDETKS